MITCNPSLSALLDRLIDAGYAAYLVGGCVRDALRGVTPHDYDITTAATPEEVIALFHDKRVVTTGLRHGTVTVLFDGEPYEITTFRVDGDYVDHRHPESVSFTRDFRNDAARRDFTMNAIGYHPREGIVDFYGGAEDVKKHMIRAVGDPATRFTEDALRILRALRFASVLGFSIEEKTAAAIYEKAHLLKSVSRERIREEFSKLLLGDAAEEILMKYRDVIAVFLPEIRPMFDFDQKNPHHIYDIYTHTLRVVAQSEKDLVLRLAAFFHDIGKPDCFFTDENGGGHFYRHEEKSREIVKRALQNLRYDNKTVEEVSILCDRHGIPVLEGDPWLKKNLSRFGEHAFLRLLALKKADLLSLAPGHDDRVLAVEAAIARTQELLVEPPCLTFRDLAVNGDDLLAAGIPRGQEIGRLLSLALDAVLSDKIPNEKEALLAFLLQK